MFRKWSIQLPVYCQYICPTLLAWPNNTGVSCVHHNCLYACLSTNNIYYLNSFFLSKPVSQFVTMFNPLWSSNVKSNIGAQFLRIISECFPRGHVLHKVFNRNNVKVSYRTMDNVRKIVSRHSNKIMNNQNPPQPPPPCRCRVLSPLCPNQCKNKDVIYMCRVAPPNNQDVETYTGLTSQTFKKRWDQHMSDCRKGEGTTLASHIGELKAKGIDVDLLTHLHWSIKK